MTDIRGCNLPEDLYYQVEKHVWAKPMEDGTLRVGMTAVAAKLAGSNLAAVTVKAKTIGQEIAQGKSVATVESSKFVGPVPAPVTGVLVRGNEKLAADPNSGLSRSLRRRLDRRDQTHQLGGEKGNLATGVDGIAAYQKPNSKPIIFS